MNAPEQDHQVDEAYGRLITSLAAPPDLLALVEGRIRVRRRRRLAGVAGAVAVVLGGTTLVGLDLGGDGGPPVAVDPPSEPSGLTITLEDGSPYTFTDITVTCRRDRDAQVIEAFDPGTFDGAGRDEILLTPLLTFESRLDEVGTGATFDLPVRYNDPGMSLFVALPGPGDSNNELSSDEDGASGTVEVVSASCGLDPHLELRVDAVLGSEVDQDAVPIRGYLEE